MATKAKAGATAVAVSGEATMAFNKKTGAVQIMVPQGARLVDVFKALSKIDEGVLAKLPRGCLPCLSGHPFDIREQFDPVINVRIGR